MDLEKLYLDIIKNINDLILFSSRWEHHKSLEEINRSLLVCNTSCQKIFSLIEDTPFEVKKITNILDDLNEYCGYRPNDIGDARSRLKKTNELAHQIHLDLEVFHKLRKK